MSSAKKRLEQVSNHVQGPGKPVVDVLCSVREHKPGHNVATITFSNPTKLNVANGQLLKKLIRTCEELSKDDKLRAVVLTGAPPASLGKVAAFIGGADIQELNKLSSSQEAREYIKEVHQACAAVLALPVPVIARVHGFALGAGLELMICCDLKLATKASMFGMPEPKIGLPSVVEAAMFPALIGIGRTRRLVYLAENHTADTAREWGMIDKVVNDQDELDKVVEEWVDMLVAMGPQSLRLQKRLVRKWENSTLEEGIWAGVGALEETYSDGGMEAKEYMKPFLGGGRKKSS